MVAISAGQAGWAEETKKIQDNSFLLEEAYNQEPGVIQHIQFFQYLNKSRNWAYSFTQEWPVPGQTHQLSYTIPVSHLHEPDKKTGPGDVALNYRYQLIFKDPMALTPRLSLLLPIGDYKSGLGSDALGWQTNIPLSVELSDKWVTHWNVGATFVSGSREPGGAKADTLGFNYGTSFIFLVSENFNLICEAAWNSFEAVGVDGTRTRGENFFINPGLRFAVNFKSGLQIVPGLAFPVGAGPSKDERGMLTYLSLEHPLF
ncbi:MAG: transporter [Elusimicrobia bacterium]|nr:transporter [Elusimicrobiota bacterium]